MTTEKTYADAATKIMALLDDSPTEPFTLERRQIEERIARIVEIAAELAADEDDAAYQSGYDEGYIDGQDNAAEEHADEVSDLEDRISDLEKEIEDLKSIAEESFAEGYQVASRENDAIETFKIN